MVRTETTGAVRSRGVESARKIESPTAKGSLEKKKTAILHADRRKKWSSKKKRFTLAVTNRLQGMEAVKKKLQKVG